MWRMTAAVLPVFCRSTTPSDDDALALPPMYGRVCRRVRRRLGTGRGAGGSRDHSVGRFNADVVGNPTDLDEFLFGSERASLAVFGPILREVQDGRCFYSRRGLTAEADEHIDHFIAWVRYPLDLGHNFVLAHKSCNGAKSDHLAAVDHLSRWTESNQTAGGFLSRTFSEQGVLHDLAVSTRIARWVYSSASRAGATTWLQGREFVPLDPKWISFFPS
jgi:hypothetical protein